MNPENFFSRTFSRLDQLASGYQTQKGKIFTFDERLLSRLIPAAPQV